MKKRPKGWWGFDTKGMDTSVSPQDDFFSYANGTWIKKTKMPASESRWGSFFTLRHDTEKQLRVLLKRLLLKKTYAKGTPAQLVTDMYRSAVDLSTRKRLGISPLLPLIREVHGIKSVEEMLDYMAAANFWGGPSPWGMYTGQDDKNSERYLLHFWQSGLGMPERDYYLKNEPEQKRVREAYCRYIEKILSLWGMEKSRVAVVKSIILSIETRLAKSSMSKEDARDPQKTYNKLSVSGFSKKVPSINWKKYLARSGAKGVKEVIVGQPEFFAEVGRMLREVPLEEWKVYLEWQLINGGASALSEQFVKAQFAFYGTTLSGTKVMKPLWRRGLGSVNGIVGESLGKMYVQEYFPATAKKMIDTLVSDLFAVYKVRIQKLSWMSAPTRKAAVKKLDMMSRKIGYPKKWEAYTGLIIRPDDYFGNLIRAHRYEYRKRMRRLYKKVDRSLWFMTPQTVNAYFHPNLNEIAFPAAILQWPFFDPQADDAINYAGIGSVIGHEMTHGFDDQGSQFDGKGNMKSWWAPKDRARFKERAEKLVAQYNTYTVADGVPVNGQLTLGENIADLGGLVIAYDAYQRHLQKVGRKIVAGLSPEKRFFLGFAQMEREISRPERVKTSVLTDPHSPAPFRINGPLANFEPFYETFSVGKKHTLYRDPSKRVSIW